MNLPVLALFLIFFADTFLPSKASDTINAAVNKVNSLSPPISPILIEYVVFVLNFTVRYVYW